MTTRMLLSLGLSALVLGGTTVGCAATDGGIASAGSRATHGKDAALAGKALAKRDAVTAVGYAEAAVATSPRSADYRMLLGQSYMQAGRFASARAAFGDVLRLSPDNGPAAGRAALNLALAEIATGDWHAARGTIDTYGALIAPSDRGLALALAGDPAGAVTLLTAAARAPGADAKLRQNLGLALALAGQWPMARAVAAADLSPADVDGRIAQWAQFAQPTHAADQVAALIGVRPVEDRGQPAALALVAPTPSRSAAEAVAALPAAKERDVVVASVEPALAKQIAMTGTPAPMLSAARIVFAPRQEVVQALPQTTTAPPLLLRAAATPMKVAIDHASPAHGGEWVVQLGAFADTGNARSAWGQATRRFAGLGDRQPQGMPIRVRGATLYRLSVSGFDRAAADTLCGRYRAEGGVCFVRRDAGDRIAQWLRPTATQLAAI